MVEFISDAIRTRRNLCVWEREGFKLKTSNYISLISISIILFLLELSLGVCISQRIFHCWIYWHKVVHLLSSLISIESAVMSYFSFQILVICVSFFFFFLWSVWLEFYQFYWFSQRTDFWFYLTFSIVFTLSIPLTSILIIFFHLLTSDWIFFSFSSLLGRNWRSLFWDLSFFSSNIVISAIISPLSSTSAAPYIF